MSDYIQIAKVRGNVNLKDDHIQLARIRVHSNQNSKNIIKDDFYTLCQKDPNKNIGLRKKSIKVCHHLPTFKSVDVTVDYLCSDLARFCLALYKNNSDIDSDAMSLIPKQEIPISDELKEYIEDFLPDFYGIRDIVK